MKLSLPLLNTFTLSLLRVLSFDDHAPQSLRRGGVVIALWGQIEFIVRWEEAVQL